MLCFVNLDRLYLPDEYIRFTGPILILLLSKITHQFGTPPDCTPAVQVRRRRYLSCHEVGWPIKFVCASTKSAVAVDGGFKYTPRSKELKIVRGIGALTWLTVTPFAQVDALYRHVLSACRNLSVPNLKSPKLPGQEDIYIHDSCFFSFMEVKRQVLRGTSKLKASVHSWRRDLSRVIRA